jgi:Zn-dependent peptidase ImmA (M78 family)
MPRISAQHLIDKYAISCPEDIDLEAIARCENCKVRYRPIEGSEARLIGVGDNAIITIRSASRPTRRRFSLAHELGHWVGDRGTIGKLCKREDISAINASNKIDYTEVAANKFASELIMPMTFFKASSQELEVSLETTRFLQEVYKSSTMATALRLIDADNVPCALAYSKEGKIQWMKKSDCVPKRLYYRSTVGADAIASNYNAMIDSPNLNDVRSSEWFSAVGSEDYFIKESSTPYWEGVLSLLWWKDESQILEFS